MSAARRVDDKTAVTTLRRKFSDKEFTLQDIREAFKSKRGLVHAHRLEEEKALKHLGHNKYKLATKRRQLEPTRRK